MAYRQNWHWHAAQRAACVAWAELQAAVALDQWAEAAAKVNEMAVAELAAQAAELGMPEFVAGTEVTQAASHEVQLSEPGGVVAEQMLWHFKCKLVLNIDAKCVTDAQVLAGCPTIDSAVAQYLTMEESKSCEHILPKARDVIVSMVAVEVGFTNMSLFMSVVKHAFNSRGRYWTPNLSAQIQHSWAKATADMRDEWPDIWMSKKAKRTLNKNSEQQLAQRECQPCFREPPGLTLPTACLDVNRLGVRVDEASPVG